MLQLSSDLLAVKVKALLTEGIPISTQMLFSFFFLDFQLCQLSTLQPLVVQGHAVPFLNGLVQGVRG